MIFHFVISQPVECTTILFLSTIILQCRSRSLTLWYRSPASWHLTQTHCRTCSRSLQLKHFRFIACNFSHFLHPLMLEFRWHGLAKLNTTSADRTSSESQARNSNWKYRNHTLTLTLGRVNFWLRGFFRGVPAKISLYCNCLDLKFITILLQKLPGPPHQRQKRWAIMSK